VGFRRGDFQFANMNYVFLFSFGRSDRLVPALVDPAEEARIFALVDSARGIDFALREREGTRIARESVTVMASGAVIASGACHA